MSQVSLQAIADVSRLLCTSATVGETLANLLQVIAQLFDGEGAILWLEDESEPLLRLRQTVHLSRPRSKAFEDESSATTIRFGQSLAGEVWAEGQPRVLRIPAMFSASAHAGFSQESEESPVTCLAFPLLAAGTINGVIEVVGCSLSELSIEMDPLLTILGAEIGNFVGNHDAMQQVQSLRKHADQLELKMRSLEDTLRVCKDRLSRLHDQATQTALANTRTYKETSQEIRSPLGNIIGAIELLQHSELGERQKELSEIIKQSALAIVDVLERLVETQLQVEQFASPGSANSDSGAKTKEPVAVNEARVLVVNGLVGSTEFIEPYATASGITCQAVGRGYAALTALRQAESAGRRFDLIFVEQVLPDMDAFEFARAVGADRHLSRTPMVLVSTFGNGREPGSTSGFRAHIAKPIKQAQVLSTVQAVLRGTSVEAALESAEIPHMPALIDGKRVILVAEDNPVNQKVAILQLKELGYWVEAVSNGKEVVEAAKQGIFDAILMDCQMPEMDGFQATHEIRNWEADKDSHIPIIAMTAGAMPADRQRCIEAGMDDYLSKPVTYDKLYTVLANWLDVDKQKQLASQRKSKEAASMENPTNPQIDFNPHLEKTDGVEPIDIAMLNEMLGVEETSEILRLFVESSQELLYKINDALNTHDVSLLKEAAHTLKGACSSIGANNMWKDCIELEQAAKAADWNKIPATFNMLERAFVQAKSYIQTLL